MGTRLKVLLVEDDSVSLMLLEYLVSVLDLESVAAADVRSARQLLAEDDLPDIAILDTGLPDGDGLELLAEIRKRRLPITVALMTGTPCRSIASRCGRWKPDAMFAKPLDPDIVGEWLEHQSWRIRGEARGCAMASVA